MDKIVIDGGAKLSGKVRVSGAKNASLPILVASLLSSEKSTISNVPDVQDVKTILQVMEQLGARYSWHNHDTVSIEAPSLSGDEVSYDLVRTMRASILVLGALIAREGRARVSLPGGCAIGARPVDQHLMGLKAMGVDIHLKEGYILAHAKKLHGAIINFDMPSVTGTENLMMAASLAEGKTIIENAAREPEVEDLAKFLVGMGAKIEGAGTERIVIVGVSRLGSNTHSVIGDRIEAGTFMAAAAITGGSITVEGCPYRYLHAIANKLTAANVSVQGKGTTVTVASKEGGIAPVNIETAVYPAFPTDMQAQMMALMTIASGTSTITETIFENRFMHISELTRMGAEIIATGRTAVVKGVGQLSGAPVMATDLRASASLVIAALAARGKTEILRVYHLDRGYEHIERKLEKLGARVRRVRA